MILLCLYTLGYCQELNTIPLNTIEVKDSKKSFKNFRKKHNKRYLNSQGLFLKYRIEGELKEKGKIEKEEGKMFFCDREYIYQSIQIDSISNKKPISMNRRGGIIHILSDIIKVSTTSWYVTQKRKIVKKYFICQQLSDLLWEFYNSDKKWYDMRETFDFKLTVFLNENGVLKHCVMENIDLEKKTANYKIDVYFEELKIGITKAIQFKEIKAVVIGEENKKIEVEISQDKN